MLLLALEQSVGKICLHMLCCKQIMKLARYAVATDACAYLGIC